MQPGKGFVDGYGVAGEVNIRPGKGQQLTGTHACPEQHIKGHYVVRLGQCHNKLTKFVNGPIVDSFPRSAEMFALGAGVGRQLIVFHGEGKNTF